MGIKASPLEWSKASESKVSAEGGAAAVCRLEGCVLSRIPHWMPAGLEVVDPRSVVFK